MISNEPISWPIVVLAELHTCCCFFFLLLHSFPLPPPCIPLRWFAPLHIMFLITWNNDKAALHSTSCGLPSTAASLLFGNDMLPFAIRFSCSIHCCDDDDDVVTIFGGDNNDDDDWKPPPARRISEVDTVNVNCSSIATLFIMLLCLVLQPEGGAVVCLLGSMRSWQTMHKTNHVHAIALWKACGNKALTHISQHRHFWLLTLDADIWICIFYPR